MLYIGKHYFEGYEEKLVLKKNGKGFRKVRIYTGSVYQPDLPIKRFWLKKASFCVLVCLFFLLLICGGQTRLPANSSKVVMLPFFVGMMAGVYCAAGVFHLALAPFHMTVFQYNEFRKQIHWGSCVSAIAMAVTSVACAILITVQRLRGGAANGWTQFAVLLSDMLCAAIMLLVNRVEERSRYICIPGKGTAEETGAADNGPE